MAEFMSHVKTVNSSIRTLLVLGICGVVGYGGYFGYENYVKPSQEAKKAIADLETLKQDFEVQSEELAQSQSKLKVKTVELGQAKELNERLATSMKLLKVNRRIANIKVLKKGTDEDGNPTMDVSFTEVDEDGRDVGAAKIYTVSGSKFYVDGWVVAFDDKYIEDADELRGASLFVFKSIYGDAEAPKDAQRLDVETNGRPGIYGDDDKSEFENKIWSDFWRVSNDTHMQQELGIRAVHGQSSYIQGKEGKTYQVELRASGSTSLKVVNEP
jgi:hypothetical protein